MFYRSFLISLVALLWATTASASGLEAVLKCGPDNQTIPVLDCLGDGEVRISRDGVKTVVSGADILAEGTLRDDGLHIQGPRFFSIQARNQSPDNLLSLTVLRAETGKVIFEQTARRFATVTFYRCGPTVEFSCREYNYPSN